MPITKSAKKALRASKVKKVYNDRLSKIFKEVSKNIEKLVKAGKKDEAKKLLPSAYKALDKATKGNTIKKNTASRKKSRLSKITK